MQPIMSIVEIRVNEYKGFTAEAKVGYAIAMEGKVLISERTGCAIWSYDRAEVERQLEEMNPRIEGTGEQAWTLE